MAVVGLLSTVGALGNMMPTALGGSTMFIHPLLEVSWTFTAGDTGAGNSNAVVVAKEPQPPSAVAVAAITTVHISRCLIMTLHLKVAGALVELVETIMAYMPWRLHFSASASR